jgi:hypothetical protein
MIHRRTSTDWQLVREYKLDASFSETCKQLVLDDIGGMPDSDKKKAKWMLDRLKLIKSVFDLKQGASKIMLASEWFLDSCGGGTEIVFVCANSRRSRDFTGRKGSIRLTRTRGTIGKPLCVPNCNESQRERVYSENLQRILQCQIADCSPRETPTWSP